MLAQPANAQSLSEQDVYSIARDAYLYAYPLVSMDVTMRQAFNVPNTSTISMRAPVNQFAHARAYPKADEKDVVRFNFDTLYSLAWLDLDREPMVLSVPDTGGRYYLLEMLDMWSDVFSVVGTRTTGTKAGNFALVGPHWSGTLPKAMTKIVAPTSAFWILGRTQTNGPADYDNVHKVQDGYKLTPLSRWGKDYTPPQKAPTDAAIDAKTPPLAQVNKMDGITMLTRLAALMSLYPPHPNDYPILFRMRALGLEPGKPFDASKLDPATVATINKAAKDALEDMPAGMRRIGKIENGWNVLTQNIGTYGTSYEQRALIAAGGLGANLPEDALYPTAFFDTAGQPLTGANKYVVHFDKDKTPPANAFWSITMYDKDGFQVQNSINRFAIGDRDKLAFNPDGSLDINIQADSPGADKESNWLPAPKDAPFQPTMRLYSPRPDVANGTWSPPGLQKVN
ncbi:MAG TPA: DUF1254 domain-containing protein [Xanthobacteraceae bacterium]|jgi:hypothetical protein|nr:DUF1254 domain-containing protein [Xanthobacteraceae bacterium]